MLRFQLHLVLKGISSSMTDFILHVKFFEKWILFLFLSFILTYKLIIAMAYNIRAYL